MDQVVPAVQEEKKTSSLNNIFIIAGETLLILVVITFAVVVLNYFNVIRLDIAFPFLSFLPHNGRVQNTVSSPQAYYKQYNYDKTKPSDILKQYLQSTLISSYLPKNYDVTQKSTTTTTSGTFNRFSLSWNVSNNSQASFHFDYLPQKNIPDYIFGDLVVPNPSAATNISENDAKELLTNYTKLSPNGLHCDLQAKLPFCETFTTGKADKEGYGVLLVTDPKNQKVGVIYMCHLFKGGNTYNSWQNCRGQQ